MLFISIGKPKIRSYFSGANLIIVLAFFIPFSNWGHLLGVVILLLISNIVIFISISWNTAKYININLIKIIKSIKYGVYISLFIISESLLIMKFYPNPLLSILTFKVIILIITIFICLFLFEGKNGLQLNYLINMLLPKSRIIRVYEKLFCSSLVLNN